MTNILHIKKLNNKYLEIISNVKSTSRKKSVPLIALFFIICGDSGILISLSSLFGDEFSLPLILCINILLCVGFHYSYKFDKRLFLLYYGIILIGTELDLIFNYGRLLLQLRVIIDTITTGVETLDVSLNESFIIISGFITLIMFTLEYLYVAHSGFWIISGLILCILTVLGVKVPIIAVLLILIYQFGFLTIQLPVLRNSKDLLNIQDKVKLSGQTALSLVLVMAVIAAVAIPLTTAYKEELFKTTNYIEKQISKRMHSSDTREVASGFISKGNNYRTGTEYLKIRTSKLITDKLYLKGYTGGDYLGGYWAEADDRQIFQDYMSEKISNNDYTYYVYDEDLLVGSTYLNDATGMVESMTLFDTYDNMYYTTNRKIFQTEPSISINIVHRNMSYNNLMRPYYSKRTNTTNYRFGYHFNFFEEDSMQINTLKDTIDYTSDFSYSSPEYTYASFTLLESIYKDLIPKYYTDVPRDRLVRLSALVDNNPLTDLDEISSFIIYTINSNTEYSLTPGAASANIDIAEDFLFNRQKGYCVHYATVAALMYRLYGIPARYASGFVVYPDEFEETTIIEEYDDSVDCYDAVVTDYGAHAWVELFIEGYGWVPVDVTPNTDGLIEVTYPGFGPEEMAEIQSKMGWDINEPSLGSSSDNTNADEELRANNLVKTILIIVICITVAVIVAIIWHRTYIKRGLHKASTTKLFSYFIDIINYSGILPDYNGIELDFVDRLSSAVKDINIEKLNEFLQLYMIEAFGNGETAEENTNSYELYNDLSYTIYNKLNTRKKIVVQLFKCYITRF